MNQNYNIPKSVLCPSSDPENKDSAVIGIILGTPEAPYVEYCSPLPVTDELIALSNQVNATEVFRIASPCAETRCKHFDGGNCSLVRRLVEYLPTVTNKPPNCFIRKQCRWFKQEGISACYRCPQVVTESYNPQDHLIADSH